MQKRVQIALAVLFVACLGLVAWKVLRKHEAEPEYKGKKLRVWLREYRLAPFGLLHGLDGIRASAEEAVKRIGTNGIPTLLPMLATRDTALTAELRNVWGHTIIKCHFLPAWLRTPSWYDNQAVILNEEGVIGFEILGSEAKQAVPMLLSLYEDETKSLNSKAGIVRASLILVALRSIGPAEYSKAIPLFFKGVTSSNEYLRDISVIGLRGVYVKEPQVEFALRNADPQIVLSLGKALGSTNYMIREAAAMALGNFGTNAQPAIPSMLLLLTDSNARVRTVISNRLKQIDPAAAAKAGVK